MQIHDSLRGGQLWLWLQQCLGADQQHASLIRPGLSLYFQRVHFVSQLANFFCLMRATLLQRLRCNHQDSVQVAGSDGTRIGGMNCPAMSSPRSRQAKSARLCASAEQLHSTEALAELRDRRSTQPSVW